MLLRPRGVIIDRSQRSPIQVRIVVDIHFVGELPPTTSTTFTFHGDHLITRHGVLQSTGTLRSGESEHHALVQWGAALSGLQSLMADWRMTVKVQLATDQHRCTWGRSKGRHIVTRYLWLQERVSRRELHIHKVSTADDRGEARQAHVERKKSQRRYTKWASRFALDAHRNNRLTCSRYIRWHAPQSS